MLRSTARSELLLAVLCIAALWLAVHPLTGVRHDAVLYLGQALARLDPPAYATDAFLSLSGQDRFTLATALTSRLYEGFGIGVTNAALLLVTQACSALLLFCLIRPWVGTPAAVFGLLLYACANHAYGPEQEFAFAEPFLTARSLAEPLVWAALLCWQRAQWLPAIALLVLASAMHPLIALPGWVVLFCTLLRKDMRWSLALLPIAALGLSYAIWQWPAQLAPFDAPWLKAIEARNAVFLRQMDLSDWCKALFPALVLITAARQGLSAGAIPRAALDAAILLLGAAALTADLLHSALPTQLQLWRGLWLMQALGLVLLPWLLLRDDQEFASPPWAVRLAALAALTAVNTSAPSAPWLIAWWLALSWCPPWPRTATVSRLLTLASALLLMLAVIASVEILTFRAPRLMPFALHQHWMPWLATPALSAVLIFFAWRIATRQLWAGGLLAIAALAASAALWDQRSPLIRSLEEVRPPAAHPWQALIPERAGVVWLGEPELVWTLLRRPVLYDESQGAATVFSRELARRFAASRELFNDIREAEIQCQLQHVILRQPGQPSCAPAVQDIAAMCGRVPGMRFFVAKQRLPAAWLSTWRPPHAPQDHASFHLHDCHRLNAPTTP